MFYWEGGQADRFYITNLEPTTVFRSLPPTFVPPVFRTSSLILRINFKDVHLKSTVVFV